MQLTSVLLRSGAALAVIASGVTAAIPSAAAANPAAYPTSAAEQRIDRVPTPKLHWYPCGFVDLPWGECDTVRVPVDYNHPKRGKTEIAVFRIPAGKPKAKIGTLFVGPSLPGASTLGSAGLFAFNPQARWFSDDVTDRFDIVMFDPRGTAFSDQLSCFKSERQQLTALKGFSAETVPTKAREQRALLASARALGKGCAETGRTLAGSMSTAQTARDMELLRRAVGDKQLSYVGSGYGSVLGQYYANMFPDRVRSLALDSVFDAVGWAGTPQTAGKPLFDRLRVVDGRHAAVREVLARCAKVGARDCQLAEGGGNPTAKYDAMIKRLKRKPIVLPPDEEFPATTFTYADWLFIADYAMSSGGDAAGTLVDLAADLYTAGRPSGAQVKIAKRDAAAKYHRLRARAVAEPPIGFDYDNELEASSAVTCTDGRYPAHSTRWPDLVGGLQKRSPDFAPYAWAFAQCATDLWRVRDTSSYTGPFNRHTSSPVLLIGGKYGWGANYDNAVAVSKRMPGSRLLTSKSWGLNALGSSDCVTGAVDAYLLKRTLPPAGTVCTGSDQPYM
jgi:pimeloyl-ACP methyl ester carboxylesterase